MISAQGKNNKFKLLKEEKFYCHFAQQIELPFIVWNSDYVIKDWNKKVEQLLGWSKSDVLNSNLLEVLTSETNKKIFKNKLNQILNGSINLESSINLITKAEEEVITEWNNILIYDDNQEVEEVVSVIQDITSQKEKEDRIKYLNFHDNLTGLYNRDYFEEELNRLNVKRQLPVSILCGDVNGLKLVNDAFGYQVGNDLLEKTSEILKDVCRKEDIIARIGGDEFAFLFPRTDRDDVKKIQERIKAECRNSKANPIKPSIALGSATKKTPTRDINEVLAIAENRMYKHKLVESKSIRNAIISSLEKSLLEKSDETESHNQRLKKLALKVGERLDLDNEDLNELEILTRLHDIGKIAIPDSILKKPGPLNDDEWSKMKEHPEIGYRIAQASKELAAISDKILSHHEKWDGTGYPNGLEGNEIPLLSRITTVVDAYDAMTNDRVYRSAMSKKEAKEELIRCSGSQFDPQVVDIFINEVLASK